MNALSNNPGDLKAATLELLAIEKQNLKATKKQDKQASKKQEPSTTEKNETPAAAKPSSEEEPSTTDTRDSKRSKKEKKEEKERKHKDAKTEQKEKKEKKSKKERKACKDEQAKEQAKEQAQEATEDREIELEHREDEKIDESKTADVGPTDAPGAAQEDGKPAAANNDNDESAQPPAKRHKVDPADVAAAPAADEKPNCAQQLSHMERTHTVASIQAEPATPINSPPPKANQAEAPAPTQSSPGGSLDQTSLASTPSPVPSTASNNTSDKQECDKGGTVSCMQASHLVWELRHHCPSLGKAAEVDPRAESCFEKHVLTL